MKKSIGFLILAFLLSVFVGIAWADDDIIVRRGIARTFAILPEGVRFPEGITRNPSTGDIYVGTFDVGPNTNKLLRFNKKGKLIAQIDFGATPLLGLAFNPYDKKVYIANFGASKIQRVDADFDESTPIENVADIPSIGPPPNRLVDNPDETQDQIMFGNVFPAPNALTFRYSDGALFVSDSFQGAIFRIDNPTTCTTHCPVIAVKHDGLLATAGFPPFGANGLAFSDERTLFIANTGDDRVLWTDVESGMTSGDISVFAESVNGADGLAFDDEGTLWAAANQADELVGLNRDGRVIFRLGDFLGIRRNGSVRGLLFPASLVIAREHKVKRIIVTNLALPLTGTAAEPEADVSKYTVSEIKIPGLRRDDDDDDDD